MAAHLKPSHLVETVEPKLLFWGRKLEIVVSKLPEIRFLILEAVWRTD